MSNKQEKKLVTIKIKDTQQLKIILSMWYSYLINQYNQKIIEESDFKELIKTPILYNIEKDELELMLYGTEDMLKELNTYLQNLSKEIKKKKNEL